MHNPAIHESNSLAPPESGAQYDLLQLGDVLRIAWRRKWLVLLGALLGVAAGAVYYSRSTPEDQAKAKVLVLKKQSYPLAGVHAEMPYLEDDVPVHVALIKSPLFVRATAEARGLGSLKSFAHLKDPISTIVSSLSVSRDNPETARNTGYILAFAFRGPIADECSVVLDAIIESYREFLDETSRNINEDALNLITQRVEEVRQELQEKENTYNAFRQNAPLPFGAKDGAAISKERISGIEAKKAALNFRRIDIQSHIAAIERAEGGAVNGEALLAMASEQSWEDKYAMMEKAVFPLLLSEKRLLEDFGPDHPDVQSIREQIEFVREFYLPASDNETAPVRPDGKTKPAGRHRAVERYLQSLQRELAVLETSEQAFAGLLTEEQKQARELRSYEFKDRQLSAEIVRTEQFYDSLIEQLHGVNLSKDLVGYSTSIIAPASGAAQVAPRRVVIFAVPTLLGILAGLGLGYLLEITDKSFHSPEEIHRRLGLPVVGHIPATAKRRLGRRSVAGKPSLDPILCTHYVPASGEAEAYRSLRTALFFGTHNGRPKVVQVTSPNAGDGKTVLVANLAVSLAQLNKKVLLIGADLRQPRLHEIFGRPNDVGLAGLLTSEAELHDAVQETDVPSLWILPSGPVTAHPADALSSSRFSELLDLVREQYDYVLVDTPALLAVTDPCVVAPCVDGTLLAIRVTKNSRPRAERAREILEGLEANLLGVVVNTLNRHSDYRSNGFEPFREKYPWRPHKANGKDTSLKVASREAED